HVSWTDLSGHQQKCDMCVFFFFQAEDGIRDGHVTGVQTCALPILNVSSRRPIGVIVFSKSSTETFMRAASYCTRFSLVTVRTGRSEERRVGKECRYRWAGYH